MRFLHDTLALSISRQSELLSKQSSCNITFIPPHYSVIIPHDNPVIQYHSLSLDLSVMANINPKIYTMFSSNHIKGQHLCPRVLIDYVSYLANHKDSHHLHHYTRIDFLEKLIGLP